MLASIHIACAIVALVLGIIILIGRKGTPTHIRLGWIYLISMLCMNGVSLFIRHLTHGYNVFHLIALISLGTTVAGILQIVFRRYVVRWLWRHYQYMAWSYVSLVAGACNEAFVHLPILRRLKDSTTQELPLIGSALIVVVAGVLIYLRQKPLLRRYSWAEADFSHQSPHEVAESGISSP